MQKFFERTLSTRMSYLDSSEIRKIFDLAAHIKNPINLSIGLPHYPTPEPIVTSLEKALRDGKTSYSNTKGILPLREKVSQKFKRKNHFETNIDDILVSSGVASLIQLLFMACIEKGDKILLFEPSFLIYRSLASFFEAEIIHIPEDFTSEHIEQLPKSVKENLKLILFSTPSNPSGYILSKEQILLLADLAENSGALLVSDEIYELFDYEKKFISPASIYPRTLTMMGFSKSYSMTGLRLAAATGPTELIKALTALQQYTVVCAPTPVQWAGITALETDISPQVAYYKQNRDLVLEKIENKLKFSYPAGAFYFFIELPKKYKSSKKFVMKAVKEKSLLLVPGFIFSFQNETQYIRLSYSTNRETLIRGITAFLELCEE